MATNLAIHSRLRLEWICLWALTIAGCFSGHVWATPPDNWEVMRVFIRDDPDQISRLVTRHYATVLLDDLGRELAEHSNLRKVAPLRAAALEDAIYVARLEGEAIISDQSRWKLSGPESSQLVELGSVSLALRTARGISPASPQLTDSAQFSPSGVIELPIAAAGSAYWFGFSVNSKEKELGRVFDFRIPPAVTAKLLVATPSTVELSSPTLVVERIASLANQLPEDWSSGTLPSSGNSAQWWLLHLSGVSQFEISAKQRTVTDLTGYKHVVRSALIDYVASDTQLEARASFVVTGHQTSAPLQMQTGRQLRIETLLVDGLPVQWQVEPSPVDDSNIIELLEVANTPKDIKIELSAISPLETSREVELPQIALAKAYVMDGKCSLTGRGGLVADRLVSVGSSGAGGRVQPVVAKRVPRSPLNGLSNGPTGVGLAGSLSRDEPQMWQVSWLGSPPPLEAVFSQQRLPTTSQSLTRFSIQAEWLAANCHMKIDAPRLTSNEMRLPVGKGWFIDSVRTIGDEPDIRAHVEDRVDANSPIIVVHWEGARRQLGIELEVLAHSPREMTTGVVSLRSPRLLTLPQADQIDNYAIEASSRYTIQVGPRLLPFQRQAFDLPVWQQELLPTTTTMWIFQGVRGSIPPITLVASSGTFTADVLTALRQTPAKTSLITRVQCTPTSGSLDRVRLSLPPGSPASRWQWSLHQRNGVGESQILNAAALEVAGGEPSDEPQSQVIELELPTPLATPFILTNELPLENFEAESELRIPVVGVPAVAGGESILLIPEELAHGLSQISSELLPSSLSRIDDDLLSMSIAPKDNGDVPVVALRLEAGISQWLSLKSPNQSVPSGWVWSETIRHTLGDNGQVEHDIRWVVEGTRQEPLKVTLPVGWWVEQVWIDDVLTDSPLHSQNLHLELPRQGRATVAIRCASSHARPGWLSYEPTLRPQLSMPILTTRTTWIIPPSRLAVRSLVSHWAAPEAKSRLVDRLLPETLWKLLAPLPSMSASSKGGSWPAEPEIPVGWSILESSSNQIPSTSDRASYSATPFAMVDSGGEWTISRTALSALAIAAVLIVASALWTSLQSSPRRWWLAATLCVLCVVLVPSWLLAPVQLAWLALSLAALLRLCLVVYSWRSSAIKPRGRSSVHHTPPPVSTTSAIALICLCSTAVGQPTPSFTGPLLFSNPRLENQATDNGPQTRPEIFSVLIPIDEAGEVKGDYAYAPTRLLELLAGGGDPSTRQLPPKIQSADYTLRMRRGPVGGPDQVQELSVEFRLQVTQADVEIRLPFDISQLRLLRGSVAGRDLLVGSRSLYQLPDAVVFRPNSVGNLRLQIQFEPRSIVLLSETQAELRCAIPTIPTATLRIVADSSSTFQVLSTGTGRKTISSVSTELLGPVAELDVQWTPSSQRPLAGQIAAEVFADTWLHARGGQVGAICQLRIENSRSLPRDLHVVAEPGWEPVGLSWEDGELIASELSTLGGRRVYTIRGHDGWDQLSRRVLRVLMVPRNDQSLASLAIPFFTLRDMSQQAVARTLAWSSEADAAWRPDGLDLWQELTAMPGLEWGRLGWDSRPQLFRVLGTLATSLRPSNVERNTALDELTLVHLAQGETKINYRGQFTVSPSQSLTLMVPRQARIVSLLVDGNACDYRRSERVDQASIEILPGVQPANYRVVEIALSQPLTLGRRAPLPRVFVRGTQSARSIYRVLCGVGLECLVSGSGDLSLTSANIPAHELLPALETLVGQIDLGNAYREQPLLPLEVEVRRRPEAPLVGAVLALQRTEQGWKGTVTAKWKTDDRLLDFAFFEIPFSIRDSIHSGQLPTQLTPLGDSGRMTLRLLPPPPVSGFTEVEFGFTVAAAASSQTLAVPRISVLAESPTQPLLALPNQIDGQVVEWSQPGRRLEEPPSVSMGKSWREECQFFELEPARTQISWKRFESTTRNAQLLVAHVTLLNHQASHLAGVADYWIAPHGQSNLELSIPQQCQVLGVEIGERPAIWSLEQSHLNVLLQPNYLPLNVRVLLHWEAPELESIAVHLPHILNADATDRTLAFVENRLQTLRTDVAPTNDVQLGIPQDFSQRWAQLIIETVQANRTRPPDETIAWLELWNPRSIGIDGRVFIEPNLLPNTTLELYSEASEEPSVGSADELWQRLWLLVEAQVAASEDETLQLSAAPAVYNETPYTSPSQSSAQSPVQFVRLTSQQHLLVLREAASSSGWTAQWLAAGTLATASLLVLLLANRLAGRYLRLIASQPWIYWLQLTVFAWWLLPIAWPSWVLGITAIGLLASQLLDARRRQRFLARV